MFLSKAQALATSVANQNAQLLAFAKKKIEACIQVGAEYGSNSSARTASIISFRYDDDAPTLAAAFQSFADAGYVVGVETVTQDGNTRLRSISWA